MEYLIKNRDGTPSKFRGHSNIYGVDYSASRVDSHLKEDLVDFQFLNS